MVASGTGNVLGIQVLVFPMVDFFLHFFYSLCALQSQRDLFRFMINLVMSSGVLTNTN